MPSASELARREAEAAEEAPIRSADDQITMADAFETLTKRARDLGFTTISDALDYVADVKRGEL